MPRIFVRTFVVPPDAIDGNGHLNNLAYLRWMQEAAAGHSAVQGWPFERYQRTGTGWVVRTHSIEYLRPAFTGDSISVLTWVAGYKRSSSPRKYLFWRASDRQTLARAETLWVFVDAVTGRARNIPKELLSAFAVVADGEVLELLRQGGSGGPGETL